MSNNQSQNQSLFNNIQLLPDMFNTLNIPNNNQNMLILPNAIQDQYIMSQPIIPPKSQAKQESPQKSSNSKSSQSSPDSSNKDFFSNSNNNQGKSQNDLKIRNLNRDFSFGKTESENPVKDENKDTIKLLSSKDIIKDRSRSNSKSSSSSKSSNEKNSEYKGGKSFIVKNGCCRECMKAFSKLGKSCLCQVPKFERKYYLPDKGCNVCACKGCNPVDLRQQKHMEEKQKLLKDKSIMYKNRRILDSDDEEVKINEKDFDNFHRGRRKLYREIDRNLKIYPELFGFGVPLRTRSYILGYDPNKI